MMNQRLAKWTRATLCFGAAISFAAAAHAITPRVFKNTTEADFADGDAYGTVITNLGDIKLSSKTTPLDGLPDDVTRIWDAVSAGKTTYLSTGTTVLRVAKDGVKQVAKLKKGEQAFKLLAVGNRLIVGISAYESARLAELKGGKLATLSELKGASYIWDIAADDMRTKAASDDRLLVATGAPGKIFGVPMKGGKAKLLFKCAQSNVLSVAVSPTGSGIFAGTDDDGLIYRIDKDGPFVVYDAAEAEIAALTIAADGTVYAGTAATSQAKPGRLAPPVKEETGRPTVETPKIPGNPGDKPKPLDKKPGVKEKPNPKAPGKKAPAKTTPGKSKKGATKPAAKPSPKPEPKKAKPAPVQPKTDKPLKTKPKAKPAPAENAEAVKKEAPAKEAKPAKEQYDALRSKLREKLKEARESGRFGADDAKAPLPGKKSTPAAIPSRPSRAKPARPSIRRSGNAIYRIEPEGFVSEVFRESVMILAIVPQDDKLIVATGNEGQVFSVNPKLNETSVLADLDSSQVTCAVPTDQGLLLGAANPGALIRMDTATAKQGGYTSKVLDAKQISMFGTFKLTADIPKGASVAVEMRSGNVGDPEKAAWSKWSRAIVVKHTAGANPLQPIEVKAQVPPARFLQYRLTLTGDGKTTPVIDRADIAYVAPNSAPTVSRLTITPPFSSSSSSTTTRSTKYNVAWSAKDANLDKLVYTLEYKPGKSKRFLPLAKDLTTNKYAWDTRHVPDGWYTLRVTASDRLGNPPTAALTGGRVSNAMLIDNTPPRLKGLKATVQKGSVKLTATVFDALSPIKSVAYSVDGSTKYQATLPDDMIFDSTNEPWSVTIPGLSPGGHVIAIRAIDAQGNTSYRQMIVTVK